MNPSTIHSNKKGHERRGSNRPSNRSFPRMNSNMGAADKLFRIVFAVIIGALYYKEILIGAWGVALLILAGIFLFTSFINWCPLYAAFGINTRAAKKRKAPNQH